jgi:nitroreductase
MMNRRESLKLGASVVAGLAFLPDAHASEKTPDKQPADAFLEIMKSRRSVRQFKPDPIPREHLLKIVDAARMAPCAGNEQPWKFVIVQDKKVIDALRDECIKRIETQLREENALSGDALKEERDKRVASWITGRLSAPAYIVVLADAQRQYPDYNQHDGPLAAGYLLLAARAFGYGTVYMTDSIPAYITQKVLNIPDRYIQVCVTPVGIPAEWPTKDKKPLDDFIVRDRF